MSKRIIAVLIACTVVFMCVFASCDNNKFKSTYTGKELEYVTDENGAPVLNADGDLYVYVTDEDGKNVTNENGEPETVVQAFNVPVENKGGIEYYTYKVTLPDGWKAGEDGAFQNKSKKHVATVDVVNYLYNDYYNMNKGTYDKFAEALGEDAVTWAENVYYVSGGMKTCKFTMETEEGVSILLFFENTGNTYKILFNSESDLETANKACLEFCRAIELKPYQYYEEVTARPTEEATKAE